MTTHACTCWTGPVTLHANHCCIRELPDEVTTGDDLWDLPCGHGDEARRLYEATRETE